MTIHKFNLQSSYEGVLQRQKTQDGKLIFGTIYPSDKTIEVGDGLLDYKMFSATEKEATILEVKEILEEYPARGSYKEERPIYRRIHVEAKTVDLSELVDNGFARVELVYDGKTKKDVKKVFLN